MRDAAQMQMRPLTDSPRTSWSFYRGNTKTIDMAICTWQSALGNLHFRLPTPHLPAWCGSRDDP
jgi:hypothetical protein